VQHPEFGCERFTRSRAPMSFPIAPSTLQLEITESVLMDNFLDASGMLVRLKAARIRARVLLRPAGSVRGGGKVDPPAGGSRFYPFCAGC
jgi:hypothetical protein